MSEDKNLINTEENNEKQEGVESTINSELEDLHTTNKEKVESKKNKKNTKVIVFTVVASVICLTVGFSLGKSEGRKLPATHKSYSDSKVIATVGDTKITGKQLRQRMEPLFYMNGKKELTSDEIKAYEQSMIDYMTTTEVLYLAGKEAKIEVSKDDVAAQYSSLMGSIGKQFGLDEQAYLKEFKMNKEDIEKDLEKELIATEYMAKETEVTDKEAQNYYNKNKDEFKKVKASHILIQNKGDDGKAVSEEQKKKNKEKAEGILKRALAGEDFTVLAKEYSSDSSSSNGGDLGFFSKGQMVEPFEKSAFALKVGEVDKKLVESDFGYHIIKKTDEKYDEFDTIKEDLKTKLSYEKQSNLVDNLLEKYNVKSKEK
ncbi:peptidylprolyl isomerase [Clostridium sp. CCUG 7971]|uniref:peptidylprolyl isomerase n=1 Tax=Clostridium sp. CCUG 7971 TaxID=2811414 RepID=UPI001ABB3216|nr:peptidylprolyl isomerase [Clostridium sp. CCUG 7971]MBO3444880.1 peptidylprolyl isomerase [Clostridium sp. CCUG 7971]